MTPALHRRLSRRLTHRSRSAWIAVPLVVIAAAALYLATELVLRMLGIPALLADPSDVLTALVGGAAWTLGVAGALALVGAVLVLAAVLPGRRARHILADDRMTVVLDDAVLAGALARAVADDTRLRHDRIRSSVGRRTADLEAVPTSGIAVDRDRAAAAATGLLEALAPRPALRARVRVAEHGVVGS